MPIFSSEKEKLPSWHPLLFHISTVSLEFSVRMLLSSKNKGNTLLQVVSLPPQNPSGFLFSAKFHDQVWPPVVFCVYFLVVFFVCLSIYWSISLEWITWTSSETATRRNTSSSLQSHSRKESGNSVHPWCRASKIERTWYNWSTEFVSSMLLNHFGF